MKLNRCFMYSGKVCTYVSYIRSGLHLQSSKGHRKLCLRLLVRETILGCTTKCIGNRRFFNFGSQPPSHLQRVFQRNTPSNYYVRKLCVNAITNQQLLSETGHKDETDLCTPLEKRGGKFFLSTNFLLSYTLLQIARKQEFNQHRCKRRSEHRRPKSTHKTTFSIESCLQALENLTQRACFSDIYGAKTRPRI